LTLAHSPRPSREPLLGWRLHGAVIERADCQTAARKTRLRAVACLSLALRALLSPPRFVPPQPVAADYLVLCFLAPVPLRGPSLLAPPREPYTLVTLIRTQLSVPVVTRFPAGETSAPMPPSEPDATSAHALLLPSSDVVAHANPVSSRVTLPWPLVSQWGGVGNECVYVVRRDGCIVGVTPQVGA